MLKRNRQIAELDGFQPRIRKHDRTRRYGGAIAYVRLSMGSRQRMTWVSPTGERINNLAIVGVRWFARELVGRGFIVETASEPAYIF
jgi:hypothetical protein